MNFIDSLSTTIAQLTRLIQRIEYFVDQMLNLTVDEMNNAIGSIQNQIADFYQDGLAILSSLDPVSLRQAVGYWTRSELRRRWISYRGRSKRGGRWLRGWGQRRYTWRPRHYQQEHNYTRQARADAIRINIRPGNVLMIMPPTQETIADILPLVQPVTWPAATEPSAPEPLYCGESAAQPLLSGESTAQPLLSGESAAQPLLSGESAAQPLLSGESAAQPLLSGESAAQPLLSGESAAQPLLSGESAAQPLLSGESAAQPALSGESAAQPLLSGESAPQSPLSGESAAQPLLSEESAAQPLLSEESAAQPPLSEASARQPLFSEPFTPQPVFALPGRALLQLTHSPWPQPRFALRPLRLFSHRSRAQPLVGGSSMGRSLFAPPSRPPRRLARALYRPQPVRLYVDQPLAMDEPNRLVYEPVPIQGRRFRSISTNSHSVAARPAAGHNSPVTGGQIVPEHVAPGPLVPEPEQVVPMPMITYPPTNSGSFESD